MCGLGGTQRVNNAPNDRRTFRHALKWAYAATLGQRGIVLLLTFVLAAILGPEDFGTVAMATAYIIFIEMFVAQGMGAAIIQRKDLSREHLDSVFWLVLAASIVLSGVSVLLSPWWAAVNHLPELGLVITFLSLSVPIKGLSVVQEGLLRRNMDFRNLALLRGAALLIGGAVGVTMALRGFGVWALVGQQLVGSALATAVMWKVSDWRPRLFFSWRRARSLFGFSGGMLASQLGVYAARQADVIVMGIIFGPVAVGLYSLANRIIESLLEVLTRSIQSVSLPHFCSLQDDAPGLRAAVLSCIRLSATITIPAMTLLALTSDHLIILLGDQWAPTATLLRIVVFIGIVKSVTLFCDPLLTAKGRTTTVAVMTWLFPVVSIPMIVSVGLSYSHVGVASQIVAVALVQTGTFLVFGGIVRAVMIKIVTQCSMQELFLAVSRGGAAALVALVTVVVIHRLGLVPTTPGVSALLVVLLPSAGAAGITLYVLDSDIRSVLRRAIQKVLPSRGKDRDEPALSSHIEG